MKLKIRNSSNRTILERTDNGILVYDVNSENEVSSKIAYEIYNHDGSINWNKVAIFFMETLELLRIPSSDNAEKIVIGVAPINPIEDTDV